MYYALFCFSFVCLVFLAFSSWADSCMIALLDICLCIVHMCLCVCVFFMCDCWCLCALLPNLCCIVQPICKLLCRCIETKHYKILQTKLDFSDGEKYTNSRTGYINGTISIQNRKQTTYILAAVNGKEEHIVFVGNVWVRRLFVCFFFLWLKTSKPLYKIIVFSSRRL